MLQKEYAPHRAHCHTSLVGALAAFTLFPSFGAAQERVECTKAAASVVALIRNKLTLGQRMVSNSVEKLDEHGSLFIGAYPLQMVKEKIERGENVIANASAATKAAAGRGSLWAIPHQSLERENAAVFHSPRSMFKEDAPLDIFVVRNDPVQRLAGFASVAVSETPLERTRFLFPRLSYILPIGKDYDIIDPEDGIPNLGVHKYLESDRKFEFNVGGHEPITVQALSGMIADRHLHFRWNGKEHEESEWRDTANIPRVWFAVEGNKPTYIDGTLLLEHAQKTIEQNHRAAIAACVNIAGSLPSEEAQALTDKLDTLRVEGILNSRGEGNGSLCTMEGVKEYLAVLAHGLTEESFPYFRAYLKNRCRDARTETEHQFFSKTLIDFERELNVLRDEAVKAKGGDRSIPPFRGAVYPWHKFSFTLPFIETATGILELKLK